MRPTRHAAARMTERNISLAEAASVIENPEVTFMDPKGNPCYIREIKGRRIKVVVASDDEDLVITVIDLDT